jgi:hypothetical protein
MTFIGRRQATRFGFQLPVIVRWRDGSKLREARTMSKDVSSKGIYFVLGEAIKDGITVQVEMTLPNPVNPEERVWVSCSGHIERSALEKGAKAGVAATIENYEFLSDRG